MILLRELASAARKLIHCPDLTENGPSRTGADIGEKPNDFKELDSMSSPSDSQDNTVPSDALERLVAALQRAYGAELEGPDTVRWDATLAWVDEMQREVVRLREAKKRLEKQIQDVRKIIGLA